MKRRLTPVVLSLLLLGQTLPAVAAESQPELNFKIYSPPPSSKSEDTSSAKPSSDASATPSADSDSIWSNEDSDKKAETAPAAPVATPAATAAPTPTPTAVAPAASGTLETPMVDSAPATSTIETPTADTTPTTPTETPKASAENAEKGEVTASTGKVLQGYIRVVPSGTKIPIIMDTAVDSDTSQEGDEFAARTGEDLNIDGSTVVPAGSVIKGRIAQLNSPKNMGRSGSVALKFDSVTTPDNRQIPIVANLVARGGVVHARRGMKDVVMTTATFMAPAAIGTAIGVLAGGASNSSSSIGRAGGAVIGAGIGAAIGVVVLCIKKGKKIDVRPGDELKIELAEDLRMPM